MQRPVYTYKKQGWKLTAASSQVLVTFGSDQLVFVLCLPPWHVTSQHLETHPSSKIHIRLIKSYTWLVNFIICRSLWLLPGKVNFPP